jgi:hypothetical protein
MSMTTSLTPSNILDETKDQLRERIDELEPLVDEHRKLTAALDAIEGRGPAAPRALRTGTGPGRPRGSGERSQQALACLAEHPEGISAADVAREIGVHPNYAYRILPGLQEEGKAVKRDRLWFSVAAVLPDGDDA